MAKQFTKEIEHIRVTATSPQHLIELLQTFWLKHGLKVTFTNYPSTFSLCISNSHNAPKGFKTNWNNLGDKDNIPKGYPGWSGTWKGNIEVLDTSKFKAKEIYFSALTSEWHTVSIMNVWYIQTGSGGGGANFSYEGMLWLYDFPLMQKEFESRGGRVEVLKKEYQQAIETYLWEYEKEKSCFIDHDPELKEGYRLKEELSSLVTILNAYTSQLTRDLIRRFNEQYDIELPKIDSAFDVDQTQLKNAYLSTKPKKATTKPELQDLITHINKTKQEFNTYIDQHPEFLF